MPIIHFINNKTQTAGGMKNVLSYVSRKEKTASEDKRFVTGVNCSPDTSSSLSDVCRDGCSSRSLIY